MLLWAEVAEAEAVVHSVEVEAAAVRSAETEAVLAAAAAVVVEAAVHLEAVVHLVVDLMAATAVVQVDQFSDQGQSLYQVIQGGVMEEDQIMAAEILDVDVGQS